MPSAVPEPLWELLYNGANITGDIADQVMEVSWMEHLGGRAAEVSVTIEDSQGKWRGSNYPQVGRDLIELSIGYTGAPLFACGSFMIAEIAASGPPAQMRLRAIQSWQTTPLRTAGNYAYENMTYLQIVQAIAARHGWKVIGLPTTPDTLWQRRTQTLQHGGDLEFLHKLATEANYEFNVRPPNIIFYSRVAIDTQTPANTLAMDGMMHYEFRFQTSAEIAYGASSISYLDPITKTVHSAVAKLSGQAPTADTLNVNERLENSQQAALKAQSRLYQQSMEMYQGTVQLPGTTVFRVGQTVTLPPTDWGVYGGTWTVSRATHRIRARGGYVTELLLRQGAQPMELEPAGAQS